MPTRVQTHDNNNVSSIFNDIISLLIIFHYLLSVYISRVGVKSTIWPEFTIAFSFSLSSSEPIIHSYCITSQHKDKWYSSKLRDSIFPSFVARNTHLRFNVFSQVSWPRYGSCTVKVQRRKELKLREMESNKAKQLKAAVHHI